MEEGCCLVDLAGRRHRVGTIAARHSDRVDVVHVVLVTPSVVTLAVLQTPTGGGDDGKAWRQFDPGGSQGQTCGENL